MYMWCFSYTTLGAFSFILSLDMTNSFITPRFIDGGYHDTMGVKGEGIGSSSRRGRHS